MANRFPTWTRYGRAPIEDLELANKAYVDAAAGGETNTASNVGGKTGQSFKQKTGVDLEFKTIGNADGTLTVTNNTSDIDLAAVIPSGSGDGMTLDATEDSNTPTADTGEGVINGNKFHGEGFTLPTDFEYFRITAIEWKNGTSVTGKMICGAATGNALQPTDVGMVQRAFAFTVTITGTSTTQKQNVDWSPLIPKGTIIQGWIAPDGNVTKVRFDTIGSNKVGQAFSFSNYTSGIIDGINWVNTTERPWVKVYYKGVGKAI